MANVYKSNVEVVDTSGALNLKNITGVKLVAGSDTATLTLKETDSSGTVIYTISCATTVEKFDPVCLYSADGLYATITGTSPKAYIYGERLR